MLGEATLVSPAGNRILAVQNVAIPSELFAAVPEKFLLCGMRGFHGGDYEECRLHLQGRRNICERRKVLDVR
jgi:hypothetical protein